MYKLDINTFIAILYEHQMMELFQAKIPPLVIQWDAPCFVNLLRTGTKTCICVVNDNTDHLLYRNEQAINALQGITLDWQAVDMFAAFVPRVWIQSTYKQFPNKTTNRKTQLVKDTSLTAKREEVSFMASARDISIPDSETSKEPELATATPEELYIAMSTFRWDASLDGITNKKADHTNLPGAKKPTATPADYPELYWGKPVTQYSPSFTNRPQHNETVMPPTNTNMSTARTEQKYPELEWTTTSSMPSIPKNQGKSAHKPQQQHTQLHDDWSNTGSSIPRVNAQAMGNNTNRQEQPEKERLQWTTSASIPSVNAQTVKKKTTSSNQAEAEKQRGHNLYYYASTASPFNKETENKQPIQPAQDVQFYWNAETAVPQRLNVTQKQAAELQQNQAQLHWDNPVVPPRTEQDRSTRQFTAFQTAQPVQQAAEYHNVAELRWDTPPGNYYTHNQQQASAQMHYSSRYIPSMPAQPVEGTKNYQTQAFPSLKPTGQQHPTPAANHHTVQEPLSMPEQNTPKRHVKISIHQMQGWPQRTRSIYSLVNGINTTEQIARLLSLPVEIIHTTLIQLQQNNFIRFDS